MQFDLRAFHAAGRGAVMTWPVVAMVVTAWCRVGGLCDSVPTLRNQGEETWA